VLKIEKSVLKMLMLKMTLLYLPVLVYNCAMDLRALNVYNIFWQYFLGRFQPHRVTPLCGAFFAPLCSAIIVHRPETHEYYDFQDF